MAAQPHDMTIAEDRAKAAPDLIANQAGQSVIRALVYGKCGEFSTLEEKFSALADEWLDSQSGRSRIDFSHPAHLQIIGMGMPAIPFILDEIRDRSGHWFEAIRSIVGSSPISPDIRGDFEAVTEAWLKWGLENGYGAT